MKIKIYTIFTILLYFSVIVKVYYINAFNIFRILCMALVFLFLIKQVKIFFMPKYRRINMILLVFLSIIVISSVYNDMNPYRGINFAIQILLVFLYFEFLSENNIIDKNLQLIKYLTLILCIISDAILIVTDRFYISSGGYYLIGNKFDLSYLHILVFTLFLYFRRKNNSIDTIKCILMFILTIIIAIKVKCSTALVGTMIVLILNLMNKKVLQKIYNSKVAIVILLFAFSFFIIYNVILNNSFVQYIVKDVLNRDLSLTGRTRIYDEIIDIVDEKALLGYGYGNSYEILMKKIAAPNTQNGLMESIFNYGIFGAIMLVIIYHSVVKNNTNNTKIYPFLAYLYMLVLLSMIEITFELLFFVILAVINGSGFIGGNDEKVRRINKCDYTNI